MKLNAGLLLNASLHIHLLTFIKEAIRLLVLRYLKGD